MEIVKYPARDQWQQLTTRAISNQQEVIEKIRPVLTAVKKDKDKALRDYTSRFDGVEIESFRVSEEEIRQGCLNVSNQLKGAINEAVINIRKFHESQKHTVNKVETAPGVVCWQRSTAIEKVAYIFQEDQRPFSQRF